MAPTLQAWSKADAVRGWPTTCTFCQAKATACPEMGAPTRSPPESKNCAGQAGLVVAWLRTEKISGSPDVRTSGSPEGSTGWKLGRETRVWGKAETVWWFPEDRDQVRSVSSGRPHSHQETSPRIRGAGRRDRDFPTPSLGPLVNGHCVQFPAVASSPARILVFLTQPEVSPLIFK